MLFPSDYINQLVNFLFKSWDYIESFSGIGTMSSPSLKHELKKGAWVLESDKPGFEVTFSVNLAITTVGLSALFRL